MDESGYSCFDEPAGPHEEWGRYGASADQIGWLDRSTLPRARRIREFLNRSLHALPADAASHLCHRLRHDPPFGRVFFELVVGRFLQVLGAEVEHEPKGLGGSSVDWRATFPSGESVLVEATSPEYNQPAYRERVRREAILGVIEAEVMGLGWWVIPGTLPRLGLNESRAELKRQVKSLLATLPDPSEASSDNRIPLRTDTAHGPLELEVRPGNPTRSPIAMASMGAYRDDSSLRVAVAARAKRHQARAFPGQAVLLAIDAPFGGPDLEDFDQALFGHEVMHLTLEGEPAGYSFKRDGAFATQRAAEYAGVLAFGRVQMFGANDPTLYYHPRFAGTLPAELLELRRRSLAGTTIQDVAAARSRIAEGIGFPFAGGGGEDHEDHEVRRRQGSTADH